MLNNDPIGPPRLTLEFQAGIKSAATLVAQPPQRPDQGKQGPGERPEAVIRQPGRRPGAPLGLGFLDLAFWAAAPAADLITA